MKEEIQILSKEDADFACLALTQILARLRSKGDDRAADRIAAAVDALSADTIVVVPNRASA